MISEVKDRQSSQLHHPSSQRDRLQFPPKPSSFLNLLHQNMAVSDRHIFAINPQSYAHDLDCGRASILEAAFQDLNDITRIVTCVSYIG